MTETKFKDIKAHCAELESQHQQRNMMYGDMVKMFMMNWEEQGHMKAGERDLMVTLSPSARNAIMGAIRLIIATDPVFKVSKDGEARVSADKLEKGADTFWKAGGRLAGDPLHYDQILSGLLFSEVHTGISKIDDMAARAKGAPPAVIDRIKRAAANTPYVVETFDPRTGFPEFDAFGLRGYYRKTELTWQEIYEGYGQDATAAMGETKHSKPFDRHTFHQYYDIENVWVWVDGSDRPIIDGEPHGLPFIPVNVSIIEGSKLFDKVEERRQPFLYTMWRSKIWNRQNLMLTVIYDLVFKMGINPQMIFQAEEEDAWPQFNWDHKPGIVRILPGQNITEWKQQVLGDGLMQAWQMAENIGTESTIYKQALGQALTGSNATFSLQSLLSQAGRLPLVWPQKKLSWHISDTAKMMLKWIKTDGKKSKSRYGGTLTEIGPSDVPDFFELSCNLRINMPQDMQGMANLAALLSGGEDPLVSKEYARDEFLNIGDSSEMDQQIWNEGAANLYFKIFADMKAKELMNQGPTTPEQTVPGGYAPPPQQQGTGQGLIQELQAMGAPQELLQAVMNGQIDPSQAYAMMQQQAQNAPAPPPPPTRQGPGELP